MRKYFCLSILFTFWGFIYLPDAFAQGTSRKHLLYFQDKTNTPYTTTQPEAFLSARSLERRTRQNLTVTDRDLPVNPDYVRQLKRDGVRVWYTSKWFNAAVVQCDSATLAVLRALPFVSGSQTLNRVTNPVTRDNSGNQEARPPVSFKQSNTQADYGRAYHQANMIGAVDMHRAGFRGEGMMVAVLDGGFSRVDAIPAFQHLFANNQIVSTFDFVDGNTGVYEKDSHGTMVLSTMAAYAPGSFIGTAYKASYCLFITEDTRTEHNIEEINWLVAAERADSIGVDVINSSLGYNKFDAPSVSYTYAEMDGRTALVSRAADMASAVGILVVTSAGNEGSSDWRYISAPADASTVLSVGAVDSLGNKTGFSSFGPTSDNRIKPNLVAMGGLPYVINPSGTIVRSNGTSFSGPILAGMATGFWQANRHLTNAEVIEQLQQTGSAAANPNNNIGYGIPRFRQLDPTGSGSIQESEGDVNLYPNPVREGHLSLDLHQKFQNKEVTVRFYDLLGKLVHQEQLMGAQANNQLRISVANLSKGLYLCTISARDTPRTIKLLKL